MKIYVVNVVHKLNPMVKNSIFISSENSRIIILISQLWLTRGET